MPGHSDMAQPVTTVWELDVEEEFRPATVRELPPLISFMETTKILINQSPGLPELAINCRLPCIWQGSRHGGTSCPFPLLGQM
jgi:hypothetical protein